MALVIESGAIVADANSFASVAQARAYALSRGITLSAVDAEVEVLLIKAMDYIQAQEARFKGERVRSDQPLSWPRTGVWLYNFWHPSDQIPALLVNAQIALAIEAQDADLLPSLLPGADSGPVTREKVDVIEVEYAEPAASRTIAVFAKADGLLGPLYRTGTGSIPVIRA